MNAAERYRKSVEIFQEACDLPADERDAFVAKACGQDQALRNAVESLLLHDRSASDAVVAGELGAGLQALVATASGEATPTRIGKYQIIRRIGQGGMGIVFEARQAHPSRTVALKVLHAGIGAERHSERFRREANFLGQLQHPGIAQVFDAGVGEVETESGVSGSQPYIAMELIDGITLSQWGRSEGRTHRQRLEMVAQICDALEHAHQRGVIHRDLKPGNILIDGHAQPKILDFGIARMIEGDNTVATLQTQTGQLLGTVPYMSPEQVTGDSSTLDVRSDVYSIGVLMYELLSGRLPYELQHRSIAEAARVIREDEPTRLSRADTTLRGDLETIVSKALEKDCQRRYPSAGALAADIRRYLSDEPILARPASALYQIRKFTRRNRALVGGVAATFFVLILGAAGTTLGLVSALRANDELNATNKTLAKTNGELGETIAQLKQVSAFQSSQLTKLDVPLMGQRIRNDLLESTPAELQSNLESALAGVNFTDLAKRTLDQNYFGRAIDGVDAQFSQQPRLQASLFQDLASTMRELGLLAAANDPQRRALDIRRRELGNENRDTIDSMNQSGMLAQARGLYEEAEARFREALAASQRVLGDHGKETLICVGNVANALRLQGKYEQAEQLARQSLDGLSDIAGPSSPDTLDAKSALAAVLMQEGKYPEAEQYFRDVLKGRRRDFGDEHPSTLRTIRNLSNLLETSGKYDESIALIKECYETDRRVLGDDHPDTIASLSEYGSRLATRGRLEEAEPILTEMLKRTRKLLGDDHPTTLSAMERLASVLEDRGRYAEAELLLHDVLETRRRVLGDEHPSTLRALGNYGFVLSRQGKVKEALPYYRKTLAGFRKVYGNDNPHTLTSIGNLASLLSGLGKDEEAEPLYRESLEGRRRLLGDDHPSTLNAIYNMGDMLRRQGKLKEAEPYCRQALEGYRRVGGDDHIGTLFSLTSLGQLLLDEGKPAEAEPYFREAVERRRRVNGDDFPQTSVAAEGLANALEGQQRWADAEQWRRFVNKADNRADSRDKSIVAQHLAALGQNLLRQKRHADAEAVLTRCLSAYDNSDDKDNWRRWIAQSFLGEAIAADPKRYADAERLLLEAAEKLASSPDASDRHKSDVADVRQRLANLYHAWGKEGDEAKWRPAAAASNSSENDRSPG